MKVLIKIFICLSVAQFFISSEAFSKALTCTQLFSQDSEINFDSVYYSFKEFLRKQTYENFESAWPSTFKELGYFINQTHEENTADARYLHQMYASLKHFQGIYERKSFDEVPLQIAFAQEIIRNIAREKGDTFTFGGATFFIGDKVLVLFRNALNFDSEIIGNFLGVRDAEDLEGAQEHLVLELTRGLYLDIPVKKIAYIKKSKS